MGYSNFVHYDLPFDSQGASAHSVQDNFIRGFLRYWQNTNGSIPAIENIENLCVITNAMIHASKDSKFYIYFLKENEEVEKVLIEVGDGEKIEFINCRILNIEGVSGGAVTALGNQCIDMCIQNIDDIDKKLDIVEYLNRE